jgi:hypothetical protein
VLGLGQRSVRSANQLFSRNNLQKRTMGNIKPIQ